MLRESITKDSEVCYDTTRSPQNHVIDQGHKLCFGYSFDVVVTNNNIYYY
jgi:hypothetical protein